MDRSHKRRVAMGAKGHECTGHEHEQPEEEDHGPPEPERMAKLDLHDGCHGQGQERHRQEEGEVPEHETQPAVHAASDKTASIPSNENE